MAVTWRAATYSEDSANITLPTNDGNDRLHAVGFDLTATAWSTPSGWTQFLANVQNYFRWERNGPDSGTETFTATGADYSSLFAFSVTGADQTGEAAHYTSGGTGATATSASFDVTEDGSLIVFIAWCDDNGATINGTPTGMTQGHAGSPFDFIRLWYQQVNAGTGLTRSVALTGSTDYHTIVVVISPPAAAGHTVTVNPGSYTMTGNAVGLRRGLRVAVNQGSYTKTGQNVTLSRGVPISVNQGVYTQTGNAVGLLRTHVVPVAQGVYTKTGQAVGALWSRLVAVAQGSYTMTGNAVTLTIGGPGGFTLAVDPGAYTKTGQAVNLLHGRRLVVETGVYGLTGNEVALRAARVVAVNQGSYSKSGSAVATLWNRLVAVARGIYSLTGRPVTLDDSGEQGHDGYHQSPGAEYNASPDTSEVHVSPGPEYNPSPNAEYNPSPRDE